MNTPRERRRAVRRLLSREERALWQSVTQSVRPLRAGAAESEAEDAAETETPPAWPDPPAPKLARQPVPSLAAGPPPLAPLGRRQKQRVARGAVALDSRIDLHGMTQERAHGALLRFLRTAQSKGAKLVLVITGKGARSEENVDRRGRGVLRHQVPLWLELPEFRRYVVGFAPAHAAHGGDGALYVQVRRAR